VGGRAERDAPRQNYDVDAKFLELYGGGRGAGGGGPPRRGLDDEEIAALRDAARRDSMSESGGWWGGGGGRRGPQDSGRGVRVQVRRRANNTTHDQTHRTAHAVTAPCHIAMRPKLASLSSAAHLVANPSGGIGTLSAGLGRSATAKLLIAAQCPLACLDSRAAL